MFEVSQHGNGEWGYEGTESEERAGRDRKKPSDGYRGRVDKKLGRSEINKAIDVEVW